MRPRHSSGMLPSHGEEGAQERMRSELGVIEDESKIERKKDEMDILGLDPVEELKIILLREDEPEKIVHIGLKLDTPIREELIELIKDYSDIFVFKEYCYVDIPLG